MRLPARHLFTAALLINAAYAQNATIQPQPPAAIQPGAAIQHAAAIQPGAAVQPPVGSKLILHTYARGVQVYTCLQVPTDTARYTWAFVEPKASLYSRDDHRVQIGKHYYSEDHYPVWEETDGSKVTAVKVQSANAPDTTAIPWLLLKVTDWDGYGPVRSTTYVQRVNTKGGKAPADGADRLHKGQFIEVPYTAEYLFYKSE